MVRLEFIGSTQGASSWYGPETGTRYVFGADPRDRIGYVDESDAPGMLALKVNRKPLFRVFRGQTMAPPPKKAILEAQPSVDDDVPDRMDEAEAPWVVATDRAREVAGELGVDLVDVVGTGKDGTVTVGDVRKAASDGT